MSTYLDLVTAGAALLAAGFWFASAKMRIPDTLQMTISGPNSPSGYMQRQSTLSAWGAIFAAVSACVQGVGILLKWFGIGIGAA